MSQLPSGMVSFLFTDIEGSTRLFHRLGSDYPGLLAEHNRLLRDVWREFGGLEIKTEGDSFFVAFESAVGAVDGALAAQLVLTEHPWPSEGPRVRMGIHTGLASPVGDDYVALAVHQAARVVGAAHGGQILISETTESLAAEQATASLRSLGHYRLRGFDDPVLLYEVFAPGIRSEFPPVRAIPADGHNILRPLTSFVGRGEDLDQLTGLLDGSRLVTVIGAGGVGKTRLVTEAALALAPSFDGGVWFADLSAAEPATPVDGEIAAAIGVQPAGREPLDALSEDLGGGPALLILDNCEHILDSVRQVAARLLRMSVDLTLLATSRVPLGLDFERILQLSPLPVGSGAGGAEQLLVDRLGIEQADVDDSATIGELCRRLDGMPLAIELAAARARTSSPEAVLSTLDDPSRLLHVGRPSGGRRQESLASVVDWSYGLLQPVDQKVFLRLSVFAASFTEDTGGSAAADDSIDRLEVAEAIWGLAGHSLLERVEGAGETRYRMLETIRAYAMEHIEHSEELAAAKRLATSLLDRYGPWVPPAEDWVDEMQIEADNFRSLIPMLKDGDGETAQLLAISVLELLDRKADFVSGRDEADRYVDELRSLSYVRPLLLAQAAGLHHRVGDFDTDELLDEAERLSAEVGLQPEWASGRVGTTRAERLAATGETSQAVALATEALKADLPERGRRAWLQELGLMWLPDDPAVAVTYFEQGLALTPPDQIMMVAGFHSNIAEGLVRLGQNTEAAGHQLEALRAGARLGAPLLVVASLIVAARLCALESRWEEAVRLHGAADRIIEESGVTLYPDDVELSEMMLDEARNQIGDAYETVWNDGYQLTIVDAAELGIRALEDIASRNAT